MLLFAAALALEGRVLERGTGDPVSGVSVRAGAIEATTDADGRFDLDVPPGTETQFSHGAYEPLTIGVPDDQRPWRVYLRPGAAPYEVVVEARRDDPVVAEQKLDRERVQQTPGTFEDPIRLLQSLPGVAQTPEYSPSSGDIAVRGGQPGDNRFYLDGIELPYLYHYNQYSSVFHTRLLDELTLYPSTFGAPWGDTLGAVVDTRSTWDHPARIHGTVNANLVMAGASVEVPVGEAWTVRASGRRSYLDGSSSVQFPVFPKFWDWFGRIERDAGGSRLALVTFGAGDAYTRYVGEPTLLDPWEQAQNPTIAYARSFGVIAFQHDTRGTPGSLAGSISFTSHGLAGDLADATAHETEYRLALREDAIALVSDTLSIGTGAFVRGEMHHLVAETTQAWPEVARESPLLALGIATDQRLARVLAGLYVEPRIELGAVRVAPGLRVDVDALAGRAVLDPRANVRWRPAPDTGIRAGAGLYSQFGAARTLAPGIGDPELPPSRAIQAAVGFDQAIAGRLEIGVDGWVKRMWNLVESEPGELPVGAVDGDALGVSLTSRYRLRDVFFAWASIDLARSTRVREGTRYPSDYDQPYAVNLVGSWTFAPGWNAGVRYRLAAGLPYTDIVDGIYHPESDSYSAVLGDENAARLPPYMKVDLHLEKRFHVRGATITPYLEAWYVPAGTNVMYLAWSYDYDDVEPVRGPGFIPLVGVRGEL